MGGVVVLEDAEGEGKAFELDTTNILLARKLPYCWMGKCLEGQTTHTPNQCFDSERGCEEEIRIFTPIDRREPIDMSKGDVLVSLLLY